MARKKKQNDPESMPDAEGSNLHHNIADRKAAINRYFEERYDIESQIAATIERHVKPLREERNELNKTFRAELGFFEADIRPDYLKFKRRRDIRLFDDQGEANEITDHLHEIEVAVYGEGGQMEWNWPKDEPQGDGEEDVRPNFLQQKEAEREEADA